MTNNALLLNQRSVVGIDPSLTSFGLSDAFRTEAIREPAGDIPNLVDALEDRVARICAAIATWLDLVPRGERTLWAIELPMLHPPKHGGSAPFDGGRLHAEIARLARSGRWGHVERLYVPARRFESISA